MSYAPGQLTPCPELQLELDAFFATCDSSLLPDPAPLNEFLWSGTNIGGIQRELSPSTGKVRTVTLRYDQPLLESQVTEVDGCTYNCSATTKRGDLTSTYELDTCDTLEVEELMNADDYKTACRDNAEIVFKKIALMMKAMDARVATKYTSLAITHFGAWQANVDNLFTGAVFTEGAPGNSSDTFKLQTKKNGSQDIYPEGFYFLRSAINKTNFCNGAALFVGSDIETYAALMNSGCCANQGLDVGDIMAKYGFAVMWDRRFENAMGHEYGMALAPRVLQPIWFNHNPTSVANAAGVGVGTNYFKTIVSSPTGIPYDLTISDNCGNVSFILRFTGQLVALPTDLFPPGHHMEGVTWVNKIKVVNVA